MTSSDAGNPSCSIIVATHNQAEFLSNCLDSLLAQTVGRTRFQVVVVNDGSTDDTPNIIAAYERNLDLIITHPRRRGLVETCNDGLGGADGKYVIRVDSDDWLHPSALEHLLTAAESSKPPDITIPYYWVVDGGETNILQPNLGNLFSWMAGGTLMLKESIISAGGYREFYWEEFDLYIRMMSQGAVAKGLPIPVLYHRQHPTSMTANPERMAKGWAELRKAWGIPTLKEFGWTRELEETTS